MKRLMLGTLCWMVSVAALAAGPYAVRKRVQASMLVTGSIVVAADGSVASYDLDKRGQLPAAVVGLIRQNVPSWRFVPVVRDGRPVLAKAAMSLRVVARPEGDGNYALTIGGSHFGQSASGIDSGGRTITSRQRKSPSYPVDAARARVSGTVYLVMRVNRQGLVDEAAAEQVNLDVVASDTEMRRWRKVLADASLQAARRWTFNPPTVGREAAQSAWVVRVPVTFALSEWGRSAPVEKYGSWHAYVPGPREIPSWEDKPRVPASVDAVAAGSISEVGRGLQLTTPLHGS
ncbi:MAG TPA: energy transducer TonB [Rhodanobacter sp.]|nr:energy transducer TonB [Rhodanobacter sp.]